MRRALRNLWMTLRATSSLWTTRSGKAAEGSLTCGPPPDPLSHPTPSFRALVGKRTPTRPTSLGNARQPTRPFPRPWWETYAREPAASGLEMIEHCNLILIKSNRLARHGHQTRERGARFLLPGGPFHCVRIGVERTAR